MADKHIPFGTHPAPAMSNAQKVSDERAEALVNNLIDAVSWQATAETNGYAAGDPACEMDADDVKNARLALITELQSLRAAPTPNAHSEVGSPIAIWHKGDAEKYYAASRADQQAWNDYAQFEANAFDNDPHRDSYDSTAVFAGVNRDGEVTRWCPPLYFPEWQALTAGAVKAEPVAITDEMVERAVNALKGAGWVYLYITKPLMRAALTAALASKPEGER